MFILDKEFTRALFPPTSVLLPQFTLLPPSRLFSLLNNDQGCEWGSVFQVSNKRFQLVLDHVNFENKVQWVEWDGVAVANTVSNHASLAVGNGVSKEIVSKISFDGITWTFLDAPQPHCTGCTLHIDPDSVCTHAAAPGLVVALGNVGSRLESLSSVFVSRNAGKSWTQLAVGPSHISIGSHGNVIAFVSKTAPTHQVQ